MTAQKTSVKMSQKIMKLNSRLGILEDYVHELSSVVPGLELSDCTSETFILPDFEHDIFELRLKIFALSFYLQKEGK